MVCTWPQRKVLLDLICCLAVLSFAFQQASYLAWSYAVDLFQDLTRMNLSTSSSIERAYKKDNSLLWRFASCHALIYFEHNRLWWEVKLELSASPYFRPYFKPLRVGTQVGYQISCLPSMCLQPHTDGAKIKVDKEYLASHPLDDLVVDELVIKVVTHEGELTRAFGSGFFDTLVRYMVSTFTVSSMRAMPLQLQSRPTNRLMEANSALLHIVQLVILLQVSNGTQYSTVNLDPPSFIAHEFIVDLYGSPFGDAMTRYARSIKTSQDQLALTPDKCFADPSKINMSHPIHNNLWSDAQDVNAYICNIWVDLNHQALTVCEFLHSTISGTFSGHLSPIAFDAIWNKADRILWAAAQSLDRPGDHGRVAKAFGLISPNDANRPTFTENIYKLFIASEASRQRETVAVATAAPKPKPLVQPVLVTTPIDSAVRSGHAFISETKHSRPKEKEKTRSTALLEEESEANEDGEFEGIETPQFPDVLPTEFKLGRKIMKVNDVTVLHMNDLVSTTFRACRYSISFFRTMPNCLAKVFLGRGSCDGKISNGSVIYLMSNIRAFTESANHIQAMRRIGFDVVQTAGSSVRFDPPARKARPITFHRVSTLCMQ
jgi:hypothetical protein